MTPQRGRDALRSLFEQTQSLTGGTWKNQDDTDPYQCDVVGGGKGVQFSLTRLGSSPGTIDDAKAVATKVEKFWAAHGYAVGTTFQAELGYDVIGNNGHHSEIDFGANDRAMTLSGGSDCVAEDLQTVQNQVDESKP